MAACTSCMSSVEAASPGVRGEAGESPRRLRCRRSTWLGLGLGLGVGVGVGLGLGLGLW